MLNPIVFAIGISIHAPIVGCDVDTCAKSSPLALAISIHAPIVGCDYINN